MMTLVLLCSTNPWGNNESCLSGFTGRIGSSNAARPGIRMQFKSANDRNLNGDDTRIGKNVSYITCKTNNFASIR